MYSKQKEIKAFKRRYDDLSRLLACADPLKTATLTLKTHAGPEHLDWLVFDKYGWPDDFQNNGKVKVCPYKGAPRQIAYL